MAILSLSDTEREALQNALKRERDALVVKRAQALLWLSQGEAAIAVAQRVGVTRQTIYNWVRTFQARAAAALGDRLRDSARSGRPPTKREAVKALIARLWEQPSDKPAHQVMYHAPQVRSSAIWPSSRCRCMSGPFGAPYAHSIIAINGPAMCWLAGPRPGASKKGADAPLKRPQTDGDFIQ
jgi:transposase